MTVTTTINRRTYNGDGTTVAFSFPYYFLAQNDLQVMETDSSGNITGKVLNTDYTVSGTQASNGTYPGGGTVTMSVAVPSGTTLTITRSPTTDQETHWVDNDPDPAAVKETAFDKLTLLIQRCMDLLTRAAVLPDGNTSSFSPKLPAVMTPNYLLSVDPTGEEFALVSPSSISALGIWTQEAPSGTVNGSNVTFALANTPVASMTVMLFIDRGFLLQGTDYTISGATITMTIAPALGQKLTAAYQH